MMNGRCPAGNLWRMPHQAPGANATLVQCVLPRGHDGQHQDQFGYAWWKRAATTRQEQP